MLFGEPYSDSSDDDIREETIGDYRNAVDDSDFEIDESEDPLKHAGAYTAEEITLITRDKLLQLQSLYVDYLQILRRRYGRKRAEFNRRIKGEKDTAGPLWTSAVAPRQKIKLEQLAACRRYDRPFGEEALLYQQSQKRRRLAAGAPSEIDSEAVHLCNALVNGMDCGEVALPNSSMCSKHILCDGKQVLFSKCETDECRNVCVPASGIKHCWFHQHPPADRTHATETPWAALDQLKAAASAGQQRSSIFAYPGDVSSTAAPASSQNSSARMKGTKSIRKVPARVGLSARPPITATDLRSAPPIPTNKTRSLDEVSAEVGVYGAYMTSTESNESVQENTSSITTAQAGKSKTEVSHRAST